MKEFYVQMKGCKVEHDVEVLITNLDILKGFTALFGLREVFFPADDVRWKNENGTLVEYQLKNRSLWNTDEVWMVTGNVITDPTSVKNYGLIKGLLSQLEGM